MIVKSGSSYKVTGAFFANASGAPSQSVRNFHEQILKKSIEALQTQSTEERDSSALVLGFNPDDLEEARNEIKKFRYAFEKRFYTQAKNKKNVMAFSLQLFRLNEKESA